MATSSGSTDLETQRQGPPREESMESLTADQSTKIDSFVPDRGLECCCEVDVRLISCFRHGLTGTPSGTIRIPAGVTAAGAGIMPGKSFRCIMKCRLDYIFLGVWGSSSDFFLSISHKHHIHRYHGARDKRIPSSYQCFDCRVRSDKNWNLIVMRDQHPVLISDFKDFTIFRYGIYYKLWTFG